MSVANILDPSTGTIRQEYSLTAVASYGSTTTQLCNPAFPTLAELPITYNISFAPQKNITCSLAPPSSQITVGVSGVYKVCSSVQLDKTTPGLDAVDCYIKVNGTAVADSATKLNLNQNQEDVITVEWFLEMNAGDFVEVVLYTAAQGVQALAVAASAPVPAIPSIITNIQML